MPLSAKHPPKDYVSHNGMVNSVSWSWGEKFLPWCDVSLLTGSTDGSAKMWDVGRGECLVSFEGSVKGEECRGAQFGWRNKVVMVGRGGGVEVFGYEVEKPDKGSVKPGVNRNRKWEVGRWDLGCKTVTSFVAVNSYRSSLVVAGGSDRTVRVLDLGSMKEVWKVEEAMGRSVGSLTIADYEWGSGVGWGSLFVSGCVGGGARVWDLRVGSRSVVSLNGHVDRSVGVGIAVSPCGRFVGTGSEDNHVYLYDIRKTLVIERIPENHKDVVSTVDFNPVYPELASGSYDGNGRLFRAPM
ncbi:WD repeat-containing protein 27 [Rhizophlyctis rosea]|uniref:WD repeat-containing protein 27 n=1 Tax=Rhizophlyctis rosea TaxID=64517 RepID=A0AAD5X2B7_9FUNG|nr:WD repeat-containing protein 27 [Rhizophlyctis rosea]